MKQVPYRETTNIRCLLIQFCGPGSLVPGICAPGLEGTEETSNMLHSEHSFVWYCNISESTSQTPEKF